MFTYFVGPLDTFGVQSVNIADTSTNGRVCLECVFSSFSTDSGCTVELLSLADTSSNSNSSAVVVQFSETFNRSGNSAVGCISDVTSGQYDIRVFDKGGDTVAQSLTAINVISLVNNVVNMSTSIIDSTTASTTASIAASIAASTIVSTTVSGTDPLTSPTPTGTLDCIIVAIKIIVILIHLLSFHDCTQWKK